MSLVDINIAFVDACPNGCLEVVKYLLTSPDLKELADVKAFNYEGFKFAYHKGNLEIVKYLILDACIEKTKDIEDFLERNNTNYVVQVREIFNVREFKKDLSDLLTTGVAKSKIKL